MAAATRYLLMLLCLDVAALALGVASTEVVLRCRSLALSTTPIILDPGVSSELSEAKSAPSQRDCAAMCSAVSGCGLVSFNSRTRLCRTLRLFDASSGPVPAGNNVIRKLGTASGEELWIAEDFRSIVDRIKQPGTYGVSSTALSTDSPNTFVGMTFIRFYTTGTGRNGSVQRATVLISGCYQIFVVGARGGSATVAGQPVKTAGNSAYAYGNFVLSAGTELAIVVGQAGENGNQSAGGGGGGGSFVYRTSDNLLYMAAGGSGGSSWPNSSNPSQTGENGTQPYGSQLPLGGVLGQPGSSDSGSSESYGGPGAGWLGGANSIARDASCGEGGGGRNEGWLGGRGSMNADGGFGGGGGAASGDDSNAGAGGGGGGYSGGASAGAPGNGGGGGGSFCGGFNCFKAMFTGSSGRVEVYLSGDPSDYRCS